MTTFTYLQQLLKQVQPTSARKSAIVAMDLNPSTKFSRLAILYQCLNDEAASAYALPGSGSLTIDGTSYPFAADDFVGFPANTAAHAIHNSGTEPLVCLVMGQRLP